MASSDERESCRRRALALWSDCLLKLSQARGHRPGSVERDRCLARFFSVAASVREEADVLSGGDPSMSYRHLRRVISKGLDAVIEGVTDSPDDDAAIKRLLEEHGDRVREGIERLHR